MLGSLYCPELFALGHPLSPSKEWVRPGADVREYKQYIDFVDAMPAIAARTPGGSCDLVLGDRFGVSCANQLTRQVERSFGELGYRVARNAPYAGGYTTEHYGRPGLQIHALQIEINRSLYMDEASLELSAGFERLVMDLDEVMRGLAATNWSEIAS